VKCVRWASNSNLQAARAVDHRFSALGFDHTEPSALFPPMRSATPQSDCRHCGITELSEFASRLADESRVLLRIEPDLSRRQLRAIEDPCSGRICRGPLIAGRGQPGILVFLSVAVSVQD